MANKRLLGVVFGTLGDAIPILETLSVLQKQGYTVAFFGTKDFAQLAKNYQVKFFQADLVIRDYIGDGAIFKPSSSIFGIIRELSHLLPNLLRPILSGWIDCLAGFQPDLVFANSPAWWILAGVGEYHYKVVSLEPYIILDEVLGSQFLGWNKFQRQTFWFGAKVLEMLIRKQVNQVCHELQIPFQQVDMLMEPQLRTKRIYALDRTLTNRGASNVVFTPPILMHNLNGITSEIIDQANLFIDRKPTAIISFGSMRPKLEVYWTIIRELRRKGLQAIVMAGWSDVEVDELKSRDVMVIQQLIPFSAFAQKAACVIAHGGSGTYHYILALGVTAICIPMISDQVRWAEQLAAKGIAPSPVREVNSQTISTALDFALSNTAKSIAKRNATTYQGGATIAAEVIVGCL